GGGGREGGGGGGVWWGGGGGGGGRRRLHRPARQFRSCHPGNVEQELAVRSDRRLCRGFADRRCTDAGQRRAIPWRAHLDGICRPCEGEARHHQLRLRRHRHRDASCRNVFCLAD